MFQYSRNHETIKDKVNTILSVLESEQNSTDKKFIDYVKYIFSNGFTKPNFTFPNKKKVSHYLKDYVEILFKKDKNERNTIYNAEKSNFGNEISKLFSRLNSSIEELKKPHLYKDNLSDQISLLLYSYIIISQRRYLII